MSNDTTVLNIIITALTRIASRHPRHKKDINRVVVTLNNIRYKLDKGEL